MLHKAASPLALGQRPSCKRSKRYLRGTMFVMSLELQHSVVLCSTLRHQDQYSVVAAAGRKRHLPMGLTSALLQSYLVR